MGTGQDPLPRQGDFFRYFHLMMLAKGEYVKVVIMGNETDDSKEEADAKTAGDQPWPTPSLPERNPEAPSAAPTMTSSLLPPDAAMASSAGSAAPPPAQGAEQSFAWRPRWPYPAIFCAFILFFTVGFFMGGGIGQLSQAGLQIVPFVILSQLAYLGEERKWARVLCFVCLGILFFIIAMIAIRMALLPLVNDAEPAAIFWRQLPPQSSGLLLRLIVLLAIIILFSVFVMHLKVRQILARRIPLDPQSLVHQVALSLVIGTSLMTITPLLVLGQPPILLLLERLGPLAKEQSITQQTLYPFLWLVPGALLVVGYGIRRNFKEVIERLGLNTFTKKQIIRGFGVGIGLAALILFLTPLFDFIWRSLGGPVTDMKQVEGLFDPFLSPFSAMAISLWAGIGEEIAIRGVLQPRLGLFLSNALFTSLHAHQYNIDGLFIVFIVGHILGRLRRQDNTYSSIIAHGTYDFILLLLAMLQQRLTALA
jgi:membrane protease YdiL (CAAX protease family)